MRYHCLTALDVSNLLFSLVDDGNNLDADLTTKIEAAISWEVTLVCHNLFVARYIDKEEQGEKKIEKVYGLENILAFEIQEGGDQFIDYLLRHQRLSTQTLDDALVEIQKGLSEHDYARAIRY